MNFRNYKVKDVDSYIAGAGIKACTHLNTLRKIIKSTIPGKNCTNQV